MKIHTNKDPVGGLGKLVISSFLIFRNIIKQGGEMVILLSEVFIQIFSPPIRWRIILQHMQFIGVSSLFIVILTAAFTGMVFALQSGRAFALFKAEALTGAVATMSIARELAPVMTSLMVTARAGSAMAAQIGTMRVTEQIDALISMAVNPKEYLIAPRVAAAIMVVPLLTTVFIFVGTAGAYVVGVKLLRIDEAVFMDKLKYYIDVPDLLQGIFKSVVFAVILAVVSCYKGFTAYGGAAGVGRVTTQAVVISSVAILVVDYFLTALLF